MSCDEQSDQLFFILNFFVQLLNKIKEIKKVSKMIMKKIEKISFNKENKDETFSSLVYDWYFKNKYHKIK